jgi:hypothetical protein
VAVTLLLLASFFPFPSSTFLMLSMLGLSVGGPTGIPLVEAAEKLPECSQLTDLSSYGVNLKLFSSGGTYYLDGQYFCSNTAPAQYHCKCSFSTTCKTKADPWGRNIGECKCCPPWVIACVVLAILFGVLWLLSGVYVWVCQGRWWCDGYPMPVATLMPRRGPAVTCPASRPLPDGLFRGYAASDFVDVHTPPPLPAPDSPAEDPSRT